MVKHGHATKWKKGVSQPSKTYRAWLSMKNRCQRRGNTQWADYGGRGISVCKRWEKFESFLSDMGETPKGMTLGRINNEGNYQPSNCRWETHTQQNNNRSDNHRLTFNGVTQTVAQWSRQIGMARWVLSQRVGKLKWNASRALTTPVRGIAHG